MHAPAYTPALRHLRAADPRLADVIDRVGDCTFVPHAAGTHFDAVARAIVYQQLSGKAAATIYRRFEELYGGRTPTPEELLATPDERLRSVGLSGQKTRYLKDLAARVASGEVQIDALDSMPDDDIVESLVRVKGVGRWTAQMFLMFRLGRPDILPDLDLGVQKGLQLAHGLKTLPTPRDVARIGAAWAPYRSIASWYLWRLLDNGGGQGGGGTAKTAAAKRGAKSARTTTARTTTARKATARKATARKATARAKVTRAAVRGATGPSAKKAAPAKRRPATAGRTPPSQQAAKKKAGAAKSTRSRPGARRSRGA